MEPRFFPESAESQWNGVEISPVFDDGNGSIDVCDEGEETYWSVYLHQIEGGVQCVADVESKEQAKQLSALLTAAAKHYTHD